MAAPAAVVARKIVFYSYAMVAATLALAPYAGWLYAGGAAVLGGWFLALAPTGCRRGWPPATHAGPDAAVPSSRSRT